MHKVTVKRTGTCLPEIIKYVIQSLTFLQWIVWQMLVGCEHHHSDLPQLFITNRLLENSFMDHFRVLFKSASYSTYGLHLAIVDHFHLLVHFALQNLQLFQAAMANKKHLYTRDGNLFLHLENQTSKRKNTLIRVCRRDRPPHHEGTFSLKSGFFGQNLSW